MSLWAVLLTGLLAGGASCAAVQGGLLVGVVARSMPEPSPAPARAKKKRPPPPSPSTKFSDDALPVGMFLAGKLASHTVLGAGLGLLGDAVQLAPRARAYLQIGAGVVMVLLALDLLGVRAMRWVVPEPPASWSRLVRRSGRWGSGLAPALLGLATVLIPCGVTLSMMFLAVASGSPLAGAAILGTFVIGTAPLFAVIGYAARRSAASLRGRLGALAGVTVLIAALVSVNAGLVLNGSSFTLAGAWRSVSGAKAAIPVPPPPVDAHGVQRIVVEAHDTRYSPSAVTARAGTPTELTIRTNNTRGCTRSFVFPAFGVQKLLPVTGDTAIDLGALSAGTYRYSCGMGMYGGAIEVTA